MEGIGLLELNHSHVGVRNVRTPSRVSGEAAAALIGLLTRVQQDKR